MYARLYVYKCTRAYMFICLNLHKMHVDLYSTTGRKSSRLYIKNWFFVIRARLKKCFSVFPFLLVFAKLIPETARPATVAGNTTPATVDNDGRQRRQATLATSAGADAGTPKTAPKTTKTRIIPL